MASRLGRTVRVAGSEGRSRVGRHHGPAWERRVRPRRRGLVAEAPRPVTSTRVFFLAEQAQQVARMLARVPLADIGAATVTVGAMALWALILHLLGA